LPQARRPCRSARTPECEVSQRAASGTRGNSCPCFCNTLLPTLGVAGSPLAGLRRGRRCSWPLVAPRRTRTSSTPPPVCPAGTRQQGRPESPVAPTRWRRRSISPCSQHARLRDEGHVAGRLFRFPSYATHPISRTSWYRSMVARECLPLCGGRAGSASAAGTRAARACVDQIRGELAAGYWAYSGTNCRREACYTRAGSASCWACVARGPRVCWMRQISTPKRGDGDLPVGDAGESFSNEM